MRTTSRSSKRASDTHARPDFSTRATTERASPTAAGGTTLSNASGERQEGAVAQGVPERGCKRGAHEIDQKSERNVLDAYRPDDGHRAGRQPARQPPEREEREQVGEEDCDTKEPSVPASGGCAAIW